MRKIGLIISFILLCIISDRSVFAYTFRSDRNQKEAKYVHKIEKKEEKEKFERQKGERHPSGYMTLEEYEILSTAKDKMEENVAAPKMPKPSDMAYVPQYNYKLVKFNNPPGSPELSMTINFHKNRQQNYQGIVSPDFEKLVYPAVYYYPNTGSTGCDLFVIKLDDAKTNLDKVLTANTMHRYPNPIMSTDKDNDNYYTIRTITPIDFSTDGKLLLAKEKVGNEHDGMWKTTPYVYDFETKTSYSLQDVRSSIEYYWRQRGLQLNDKRWDVYPLGFGIEDGTTVYVKALAYTGNLPVRLGTWSISAHGESPKLVSMDEQPNIQVGMNGLKLEVDGAIPQTITKREEKFQKRIDKAIVKEEKKQDRAELKEMKKDYKAKIKEMNSEFKESQKDYAIRQKINSTTSENDALEKYQQIKEEMAVQRKLKLEKQKEKALKQLEKQKLKEEKSKAKSEAKKNKNKTNTQENDK